MCLILTSLPSSLHYILIFLTKNEGGGGGGGGGGEVRLCV